jgi:FecR protein
MNELRDQAARVSALVRRLRRDAPPDPPRDRRRLQAAVEEALRDRGRHRARVRWVASGAALAAGLALVIGGVALRDRQRPRPSVSTSLQVEGDSAAAPGALTPGTRLVAPAGGDVRVGTADGTNLTVERGGELAVVEAGTTQRFALDHGAVRAHVTRLPAGRRFIIQTADAEVEVHGTRFRVAVVDADPGCGAGTKTRVSVDEGVVAVRTAAHDVRILPGGHWPTDCAPETPTAAPLSNLAVAMPPAPLSRIHKPRRQTSPEIAPVSAVAGPVSAVTEDDAMSASDVAIQNRRYAEALRAKREGDVGDALRRFGDLLAAYPHGPLAESVMVQRMNLLQTVGGAAASRAAADYLARFPDGFARVEARRLLTAPTP